MHQAVRFSISYANLYNFGASGVYFLGTITSIAFLLVGESTPAKVVITFLFWCLLIIWRIEVLSVAKRATDQYVLLTGLTGVDLYIPSLFLLSSILISLLLPFCSS